MTINETRNFMEIFETSRNQEKQRNLKNHISRKNHEFHKNSQNQKKHEHHWQHKTHGNHRAPQLLWEIRQCIRDAFATKHKSTSSKDLMQNVHRIENSHKEHSHEKLTPSAISVFFETWRKTCTALQIRLKYISMKRLCRVEFPILFESTKITDSHNLHVITKSRECEHL